MSAQVCSRDSMSHFISRPYLILMLYTTANAFCQFCVLLKLFFCASRRCSCSSSSCSAALGTILASQTNKSWERAEHSKLTHVHRPYSLKWTDFDPSTLRGCVHRHFKFKARSDMCLRQSLRGRLEQQIQVCSVLSYRLFSGFCRKHLKHPEAPFFCPMCLISRPSVEEHIELPRHATGKASVQDWQDFCLIHCGLLVQCRWLEQKDSRLPKFGKKVARRRVFSVSFSASWS